VLSDLLSRHERLSHNGTSGNTQSLNEGSSRRRAATQKVSQKETHRGNDDINSLGSPLNVTIANEEPIQQPSPQMSYDSMLPTLLPSTPSPPPNGLPTMISSIPGNDTFSRPQHQHLHDTYNNFAEDSFEETSNTITSTMADLGQIDYGNPYFDFMSFIDSVGIPEQPIPYFSPDPIFNILPEITTRVRRENNVEAAENSVELTDDIDNFSRSGCRLPSLQPESNAESLHHITTPNLWEISLEDRERLITKLNNFILVIPPGFVLPSRHALSRYLLGYVKGFHDYLPFLHIPTVSITKSAPELILAIAGLGSRYCMEADRSVELFHVAKAVAMEQIRRRDERWVDRMSRRKRRSSKQRYSIGSRSESSDALEESNLVDSMINDTREAVANGDGSMEIAQALLLLMAMATWGADKALFREGLTIRSVLATLIRQDGLSGESDIGYDMPWEDWIRIEGAKRTKFMVFANFNFHCIVFNTPPLILAAEMNMRLPCWESEWKAKTAAAWQELRRTSRPEPVFQESFQRLFSNSPTSQNGGCSSLGSYVLVHALIQHTFLMRQINMFQTGSDGSLPISQVATLEQALKNWQYGWEINPESSLDPMDPHGPVAFNSTALLRMAYIRLSVDIGPGRALDTQDPILIARAIWESPPIKRNRKVTRAVLHSAHALSIPVKLGVNLVARNQLFTRSIQHSLCSLECAFLLSKWLEAVTVCPVDPPLNEDERMLLALVTSLVNETEFAVPAGTDRGSGQPSIKLSASMVRVWAKLFKSESGDGIWDIVDLIGRALDVYADMLDTGSRF
jgi:hypothetical protein